MRKHSCPMRARRRRFLRSCAAEARAAASRRRRASTTRPLRLAATATPRALRARLSAVTALMTAAAGITRPRSPGAERRTRAARSSAQGAPAVSLLLTAAMTRR